MRTGSKLLMWVVCGLLVTGSVAAFAQDVGADLVRLSVTLRADYTDNRDSQADENAEETWDFYVKPRMDLFLDGERGYLDFMYAPAVRHRTDPSISQNDEQVFHDLELATEYDVNPSVSVRAIEELDFTDDPEVEEQGVTVRDDRSYLLNRTTVGVNYQATKKTDVDVSGHYMDKAYDEDDVALKSDENRSDAKLTVSRILNPSLSVFGLARYSDFGFESSVGLQRDFESVLLGVGCEKTFTPGLLGGATAGWQTQSFEDDGIEAEDVPYVKLWMRGSTVPTTHLTGEITHGLRDADVYPYAAQEFTDVRGILGIELAPRVDLELLGVYRRSDYEESRPSSLPVDYENAEAGVEDRYIAQATVGYEFDAATTLSLTQRYEDLESEVDEDFTKNTTQIVFGRRF